MFGHKDKAPAFRPGARYRSPGGQCYTLYADMLKQKHLLVAGATGSGKSVLLSGLIYTAMLHLPTEYRLILIDPKRVELKRYARLPHTITHASEPRDMVQALLSAVNIIEARYREMEKAGSLTYNGSDVYVIIDELADLMCTNKKEVLPLLQRICQIGRAARVHVIAATQCPLVQVIPTQVKVNFDSVVGLHTATAQHSRNIIGATGCETLPQYGQGIYCKPGSTTLHNIPMHSEADINALIRYWTSSACAA